MLKERSPLWYKFPPCGCAVTACCVFVGSLDAFNELWVNYTSVLLQINQPDYSTSQYIPKSALPIDQCLPTLLRTSLVCSAWKAENLISENPGVFSVADPDPNPTTAQNIRGEHTDNACGERSRVRWWTSMTMDRQISTGFGTRFELPILPVVPSRW